MRREMTVEEVGLSKFDSLKPLRISERTDKHNRKFWECLCDCGKLVIRREDYLIKGKGNHSCGCQSGSRHRGSRCRQWRGCGELGGYHFTQIRKAAEFRDIEFAITVEYAWQVFVSQKGFCKISGVPIGFATQADKRRDGKEQTASLDRINNDLGYIEGNVQWVHKDFNRMKGVHTMERLVELCRLVVNHADARSTTA